jgi:hypothetical protein
LTPLQIIPGGISEGGSSSNNLKPGRMWLKFFFYITSYCEWPNAMKFQNEVIFEK